MAQGAATSADCPGTYDVVIDGKGYMLLQTLEPSIPFRTHRAIYSYSPTFLERTNVSSAYGDNAQDFFLTQAQSDWSLGEDQRFFRQADVDSIRRTWAGANIDISVPGQASIRPALTTTTTASLAASAGWGGSGVGIFCGSTTNLYEITNGANTDRGAHGAGGLVTALAFDGQYVYLSGTAATSVRRYDTGAHTFASFSATACGAMCFQNNTLYGSRNSDGALVSFDTAGNPTALFTWKNAIGSNLGNVKHLAPYGGKVAALCQFAQSSEGSELWLADANGAAIIAKFPETFTDSRLCTANGILFIIGTETNANVGSRTVIYYLANGNLGRLYSSSNWTTSSFGTQAICRYQSGLLFTDIANQALRYYNIATGGVSTIASYASTSSEIQMASGQSGFVVIANNTTTVSMIATNAAVASSASIASSLFDFDNTLTKQFRSVKVDFIADSTGNGGSVDIFYQVDGLEGSWTTLQTSAATGTEYLLPANTTGRAISILVGLNKGTATNGPKLKRVYVRAAPQLQSYRLRTYILDLSGIGTKDQVHLADGTQHTLTGHEQAINLNTTIGKSSISVSDRFCNLQTSNSGTTTTDSFTAVCEPADCEIYDVREGWDNAQDPGGYVAKITVREI